MQSKAATVEQYLSELPPERREALEAVRAVILQNLDPDYEEGMQYGMIGYYVPHRVYPPGYHCDPRQPLPYACLASQKNHMSLSLMSVYAEGEHAEWFREQWKRSGKKLDMGKSCIRFKKLADLPLDVIAEAIRRMPAREHIAHYESALLAMNKRASKRTAPRKVEVPMADTNRPGQDEEYPLDTEYENIPPEEPMMEEPAEPFYEADFGDEGQAPGADRKQTKKRAAGRAKKTATRKTATKKTATKKTASKGAGKTRAGSKKSSKKSSKKASKKASKAGKKSAGKKSAAKKTNKSAKKSKTAKKGGKKTSSRSAGGKKASSRGAGGKKTAKKTKSAGRKRMG